MYDKYKNEDFNRYFGVLYGIEGAMEKRKVKCLVLVRTSTRIESKLIFFLITPFQLSLKIVLSKKYTCDLGLSISDAIRSNGLLDSCMIENKKQDKAFVIIDETG